MKKYKFTKTNPDKTLEFYEKSEEELTENEKQVLMNTFIADFNELPTELKLTFIHQAMQSFPKNDSPQSDDTSL
jgi:hypothetical protein